MFNSTLFFYLCRNTRFSYSICIPIMAVVNSLLEFRFSCLIFVIQIKNEPLGPFFYRLLYSIKR